MASVVGIFRVLCALFVQSVIWSMCDCIPIKNDVLQKWDDDWIWTFTTPNPFEPSTSDGDLRRITDGPPKLIFEYKTNFSNPLYALFAIPFIVFIVSMALCQFYIWKKYGQGYSEMDSPGGEGSSSNVNLNDRPPGYSDVVLSDYTGGEPKFPVRVPPKPPPETPPPTYDDGCLPRY